MEALVADKVTYLRPHDLRPGMVVVVPRGEGREELFSRLVAAAHQREDMQAFEVLFRRWRDACWEADIIISTVPCCEEKQLAEKIKQVATGKIVISLGGASVEGTARAESELQQLLPYSKVVRTLIPVADAGTEQSQQVQEGNFLVAGRDEEALETAIELLQQSGLKLVIGKAAAINN